MGVLNVTPDSFSDGGENLRPDDAVAHAVAMHAAGAAIIDVGGESTRPGSDPVSLEEELSRVLPVVGDLADRGIRVSIDTTKVAVAEAAVAAGAELVNDVSACGSPGMIQFIADSGVGVVLMHSKGKPKIMQADPTYNNVVEEVREFLVERVEALLDAGAVPGAIAIDPGIGFGKTVTHNLELLAGLETLGSIGRPLVLGTSRKSFLGALTGIASPRDRDGVTAVTTALGYERGARVFRVHDVVSSRDALAAAAAIVTPERWDEWLQG